MVLLLSITFALACVCMVAAGLTMVDDRLYRDRPLMFVRTVASAPCTSEFGDNSLTIVGGTLPGLNVINISNQVAGGINHIAVVIDSDKVVNKETVAFICRSVFDTVTPLSAGLDDPYPHIRFPLICHANFALEHYVATICEVILETKTLGCIPVLMIPFHIRAAHLALIIPLGVKAVFCDTTSLDGTGLSINDAEVAEEAEVAEMGGGLSHGASAPQ